MLLVVILLLAVALRLFLLDRIPTSITGDELSYILSSKAFLMTGVDPSGTVAFWQPLIFKYPLFNIPQAELNYFLLLPFLQGDFSLFAVRLPFAFLGVVLVAVTYFVAQELFNKKIALVAAFFASINPWLIVMSRTAYEMTPSMTFYLLGLLVLLKTKGWKIFFAFPFLLLAFYAYIGTKLVFLPFVLLTLGYLYFVRNKRKFGKQYLLFAVLSVLFVGFFVILLTANNGTRLGDILLPNSPLVAKEVNAVRAASIHTPVLSLFVNKVTVYGQLLVSHFLTTLSAPYLFLTGDSFFGLWKHGLFYVLDVFFLFLGAFALLRKEKSLFFFLGGLIIVGLIPQIAYKSGNLFTPHITFIFPFVLMLVAYGIVYFVEFFKNVQKMFLVGIMVVYGLFLGNFLLIYFTQYPIQGDSDLQVRVLSRYVTLAKEQGENVIVYSSRSNDLLRKYVFYASLYTPQTIGVVRHELTANEPEIANVAFRSCDEKRDPSKAKETIATMVSCKNTFQTVPHVIIGQLVDGGAVFKIYNDKVCNDFTLKPYPSGVNFSDFAVEKLSKEQFCKTFITSLF